MKRGLSKTQRQWYFREWKKVEGVFVARGEPLPERHSWQSAQGLPASSTEFSNGDFDRFLCACRAVTQPDNIDIQLRCQEMPATRLRYRIRDIVRRAGLADPDAYWAAIARDKFGHGRLADLRHEQLLQLRDTLVARLGECLRASSRAEATPDIAIGADIDPSLIPF